MATVSCHVRPASRNAWPPARKVLLQPEAYVAMRYTERGGLGGGGGEGLAKGLDSVVSRLLR